MHLAIVLLVFAVIFVSELPDKSMFASLLLSSRFPGFYVWLGAAAAFLVHVIIAVSAGNALSLLPHRVVAGVVAAVFLAGALLLFFGRHGIEDHPLTKSHNANPAARSRNLRAFITAFGVIFIGEWGDITQLATANYTAHYHDPLSVGLGAILGLWAAAGLAIISGNRILRYISAQSLQRIAAIVLLIFAVISAHTAIVG